jgi:riboflavin synthase
MFTGLIEEVGKVTAVKQSNGILALEISAVKITHNLKIGDSISVNGVCLTVTRFNPNRFNVDAAGETLKKTTIGSLKVGTAVNLEPALQLSQKLGGHLVQGHVNDTGIVTGIRKAGNNYILLVMLPHHLENYLIKEGSIAIDGISLTIADIASNRIVCSIIPHTWQNTNLRFRKVGERVNLEIDVISKYVEKFTSEGTYNKSKLSEDWLIKLGY